LYVKVPPVFPSGAMREKQGNFGLSAVGGWFLAKPVARQVTTELSAFSVALPPESPEA
jgi:hypothetical protein